MTTTTEKTEKVDDDPTKKKPSINLAVLFRYSTRNERILLVVASFCAFIEGGAMPAFTYVFGAVLDTVGADSPNSDFIPKMNILALSMLIIAVGVFVMGSIWSSLFNSLAVRQANRIRRAYLASVLSKDVSWFDLHEPGIIPSRLAADVDKVENAIAQKAGMALMNSAQALSGIILAFVSGWAVALVVCTGIPFIAASTMFLTKSMANSATSAQKSYAKAGSVAEEVLGSIRTVAAFGGELFELNRYKTHLSEAKTNGVRMGVKVGISLGLVMFFVFASYALTFWFGAWLIDGKKINAITGEPWKGSEIIIVFFSLLMGTFGLAQIGPSLQAFAEGTAALKELYETINSDSQIEPSILRTRKDGTRVCDKQWIDENYVDESDVVVSDIEFRDVSFFYPSRPEVQVLNGVSMQIKAGQKIAFVGESGSGKSTLIQLLERFYDPHSGEVLVNGSDIKKMNPRPLRSLFGYVGQEPVMFATSIRANLVYGLRGKRLPTDEEIYAALKRANAYSFVISLPDKLDTYCGPGGSQMSGGQKQRIAIARALLRNPQILLLDEATSALDNESEKMVQQTIDSLQQDSAVKQLTTISVAHRLSTIRNSDVIFVLQKGVLVEHGSHTELMKRDGVYKALVASQEKALPSDTSPVSTSGDNYNTSGVAKEMTAQSLREDTKKSADNKLEEDEEKERVKQIAKGYKIPWSRLVSYTKPERWLYVPAILGSFAKGIGFPIHAMLFSAVIAWYYQPDDLMQKVSIVSIKYVGLGVGVLLGIILSIGCFAFISESFTLRIREACFRHILSQDMGFFDHPDNAPAKLQLALSTWAAKMNTITTVVLGVMFEVIAALIAGFIIAFLASAKLAGIIAACLPLVVGSAAVMTAVTLGADSNANNVSKQAASAASEAVQNMRTVRALNGELATLALYESYAKKKVERDTRRSWITGLLFGFAMACMFLPYSLGYYVAGGMIADGELTLEDMSKALVGLLMGAMAAGQALSFLPDVAVAKTAAHDMFVLLDRESKISPFDNTRKSERANVLGDGVIEFRNVEFGYPQRPEVRVLKGLSFKVNPGKKVALVGPSGSGKSSVMALLQRFYDCDAGEVLVGGRNVRELDVSVLRSVMGYVGQEPVLFDTTMENNVLYGNPNASKDDLERVQVMAKLDFVNKDNVRWDTVLGPKGGLLSGGQKQRTAIARAMIRDPKILLLDEATSALDSASEQVVQRAIDGAAVGRTTFVIAHRLSTIEDADLILVVSEGRVVEQGTHQTLMNMKGAYYQLYLKGQK
jgi:ATP-binding cassette subfamily B (MDR/TAP) protein 1